MIWREIESKLIFYLLFIDYFCCVNNVVYVVLILISCLYCSICIAVTNNSIG